MQFKCVIWIRLLAVVWLWCCFVISLSPLASEAGLFGLSGVIGLIDAAGVRISYGLARGNI